MIDGDDLLSNSDDEAEVNVESVVKSGDSAESPQTSVGRLVVHASSAPTEAEELKDRPQSGLPADPPPNSSSAAQSEADDDPDSVFKNGCIQVFIRAYEKRGEGINAYLVYKIETRISNIPGYTKGKLEVWRRFSDFLGLREGLMNKYQPKGILVPAAPEKSISALTKTKLTTTAEDSNANDIADKRSRQIERFLRRLVSHPRLVVDCDVRDFLSFDGPLPKADHTSALSSNSIGRMFRSFGDAFTKLAFPMDENDRWFEQANSQVEEMDEMLVRLNTTIEQLFGQRRELAASDEQLSKSLSMLASCEENTALARSMSKLAESHENIAMVERHEADIDYQQLDEPLQEQLHLTCVLKEVLYERVKAWQNWQNQQQALARKREAKTRWELSGKLEKAALCKNELKDHEEKADLLEKDFLQMSKSIRQEYGRYGKQRREDIKNALIAYLESLIETEERTLEYWEKFVPETQLGSISDS